MNTKRIFLAAAVCLAAAVPAFSMAVADLAGVTGNGHYVERERSVKSFTVVVATGSESVRVHKGAFRVVVGCDENLQDLYRARVSGNRLELGFESGTIIRNATRVEVDVWLPELEGLTLSGSGDIEAVDAFAVKRLELVLSGSGSIVGRFSGGDVGGIISGSGSIETTGTAETLEVTISGSGDFDARNYSVGDARVSIAGSGSVDLGACEKLEVGISGSGDVSYEGTPRIDVNVSGSGKVRRR